MTVIVRFAPSPTGFLHIGGARTALFNWLYAKHVGGQFRLRIEDTDRARSTVAAVEAIVNGLNWLGLDWDGDIVHQSDRLEQHADAARQMLASGNAYQAYESPADLAAMRDQAKAAGRSIRYEGVWRDRDPRDAPPDIAPVVRLKAPRDGATTIRDHVQGEVTVANQQLDDLIILRADGTPTYNLSVVVDDHDMGISHVIRGDDHFTNAFRQTQIYRALGWEVPEFAHVPLIHGPDGAKLSKRHGALGVDAYRDMGYLPEALRNYLLRLGWSHGDDEIISTEEAIAWFDIDGIGKSPARFDFAKLANLNGHYIREAADDCLLALMLPALGVAPDDPLAARLKAALPDLKSRAKTIEELTVSAGFYVAKRPIMMDAKAAKLLDPAARELLAGLAAPLAGAAWDPTALEALTRDYAEQRGVKLGAVAQPLRVAITGSTSSPPLFSVMSILGRDETLGRLRDAIAPAAPVA
ncbi:MAG TPA: glutamate--tRNA ligase [Stellaceae bacterium]